MEIIKLKLIDVVGVIEVLALCLQRLIYSKQIQRFPLVGNKSGWI